MVIVVLALGGVALCLNGLRLRHQGIGGGDRACGSVVAPSAFSQTDEGCFDMLQTRSQTANIQLIEGGVVLLVVLAGSIHHVIQRRKALA